MSKARFQWLVCEPPIPNGYRSMKQYRHYCVNSAGLILSCRGAGGRFREWRSMSPALAHRGTCKARLYVVVRRGKLKIKRTVHSLVLETFIGPRPPGKEACHNDGNHLNNTLENLRWDTHKNNMADRQRHGRLVCKLTDAQVLEVRALRAGGALHREIAARFGVCITVPQFICRGKTYAHVPITGPQLLKGAKELAK